MRTLPVTICLTCQFTQTQLWKYVPKRAYSSATQLKVNTFSSQKEYIHQGNVKQGEYVLSMSSESFFLKQSNASTGCTLQNLMHYVIRVLFAYYIMNIRTSYSFDMLFAYYVAGKGIWFLSVAALSLSRSSFACSNWP